MKGNIVAINDRKGMVAVDTQTHGYSIFEMLSDTNFNIGDNVSWIDDTTLGHDKITNHTKGEVCEVYFQNHHVSQNKLSQQLLIE